MSRRVPGMVAWIDVELCAAFGAWAGWLRRRMKEERVLSHTFGEAYREYRARTWF